MGKIEKNSIKYLACLIIAISVAGMILWPIFDFVYSSIISHSEFNYSVAEYVVKPISFGAIIGLVLWLMGEKGK